jgi:hypothetical protein
MIERNSSLVLFRLVLILLLNALFHFKPNLRSNFCFVHLTGLCLGIYTRVRDDESKSESDSNLRILISNHISCLDFFSIKTVYNQCNAAVSYSHSNRNLHTTQSATGFFERFTCKAFHDSCLIQSENFTRNKSTNHPLVFFPELMSTNDLGRPEASWGPPGTLRNLGSPPGLSGTSERQQ